MLKLKKLQILGFKSFCDRTELKFNGDGIAAVVGPNGCGKSNISDAVAWVLGEQSARSLRGARMEDVIFAGTRERKPTGMAEVTMHLIDPDNYKGAPVVEAEIEIRDDMSADDWDEAALVQANAEEAEEYIEAVRPGQTEEGSLPAVKQADSAANPESLAGPDLTGAGAPAASETAARISTTENAAAASAAVPGQPQVVLKIRRRKFKRSYGKGEIVVTRRLFRSGESEYQLNGKFCRLRDIQDIFMGTGLGPESYALIEQGRIGQILSSKPTDRRNIIEEAAGITRFKARKRLAEARLEDARQNLARINDIFDEVTRQMNSLKRQAAKAERYARLRDEMRGKLRLVLASRFTELQQQASGLESELNLLSEELAARTQAAQLLETEHSERAQRGYAIDNEARQTRERLSQLNLEMDRSATRSRTNDERCAELAARSAAAEGEIVETSEQLARLQEELAGNQQVLESAAAEVAAAQAELRQRQQEAQDAASALQQVEREQEQHRHSIMDAIAAASGVRNRITQAEERIAALEREAQRLQKEISTANQQAETFGGQRGQISLEFDSAQQRVASVAAQIAETRRQLEEKRQAEAEGKRSLDRMRAEFATLQGKRASLESVIAEHGYSSESVRKLFRAQALQGGMAPSGVLADFLEVDDRFEGVVDEFLREELNYIVVKSWDAADEGLRLLRSDVDGRATFLVHPDDAQAKFSFVLDESARPQMPPEQVTPLKNCVRVLNGFGKSLEVILPKLGNGYIVSNPDTGRSLALENPDAFFLSQSGECFHNVMVTGGKQRSEGPLSLKRELREVLRQMAELERILGQQETRVALLGREIGELAALLDKLENDSREADKQALTSGHTLRQLDSEMARVRERLGAYENEAQRVARDSEERRQLIAGQRQELEAHEERRTQLETQMKLGQDELERMREARDQAAQAASQALAMVATLEERRRAAASSLSRIQSMAGEVNR
ncbi:MAG: AAA family ATPase, partial [Candidatus Korobacteraceae bacterium]